ncbi:MAG TPA: ECF-type sigma factor [Thermoanaerobaculia bacterium]|nr:ECF-type sigma factor [Thermoanaerobaculia bacterium]
MLPLVHESLRRLAGNRLRADHSDHSLSPTDLVHEAYFKLVRLERVEWQDRAHLYALAARVSAPYAQVR